MKNKNINIVDEIFSSLSQVRHNKAISDGKKTITYDDLYESVVFTTAFLCEAGVNPYDRVALFCDDSIEYIVLSLAILKNNAVVVPVSPGLSSTEFANTANSMKVKYIFSDRELPQELYDERMLLGDILFYKIQNIPAYEKEYLAIKNPAFIRFSSGTTGASKGVLLTHNAISERTAAANEVLKISANDNVAWLLSMSFHFVVTILLFLKYKAHIVICSDDFPFGAVKNFINYDITFIYASPFHYSMFNSNAAFNKDMFKSVRMSISTAIALNKDIALQFKQKFEKNLFQAYGIIEIGLPFINSSDNENLFESIGMLLPAYEVKLEDKDAEGRGRIFIKGPGMYSAYIKPWSLADEWFDTGDIGYFKDEHLFISGRHKNVINFAGMKIFPQEVEAVIMQFPGISEARVYAQAHNLYGQLPCVEYISSVEINHGELKKFCISKLDLYKVPKQFNKVLHIEKTLSGKVKRV